MKGAASVRRYVETKMVSKPVSKYKSKNGSIEQATVATPSNVVAATRCLEQCCFKRNCPIT